MKTKKFEDFFRKIKYDHYLFHLVAVQGRKHVCRFTHLKTGISFYIAYKRVILIIFALLLSSTAYAQLQPAFVPDTPEKVEKLVMAIYQAEGGKDTNYPFGIKSVTCEGYDECKRICKNTVRNNVKRWENSVRNGDLRDYITFLWHRYAPPNEHPLNLNWKDNVLSIMRKEVNHDKNNR